MSDVYNCPKCGVKTFYRHSEPLLLPRLIKSETGNGLATDTKNGIGVHANICETCRHIEFTLILGNEDLTL